MAFPQVAATNGGNSGGATTSHVCNLPSGISAGDLLLLSIGANSNPTFQTPSGWTEISSRGDHIIFGKFASGSEGSTVTVTSTTSVRSAHLSYRITGHHSTRLPTAPSFVSGSGTAPNPPSNSPSYGAADTLWLAFCHYYDGIITVSAYPTNYTNGLNFRENDAAGPGMGSARRELNASSEDPGTFGLSASAPTWTAQTVAIRPDQAVYTETDGTGVACTGVGDARRVMADGGTPGTTEITLAVGTADGAKNLNFQVVPAAAVEWNAGVWTPRINCTLAEMNSNWTACRIRRYNSSCVLQETLGEQTTNVSMGTTGVKSRTITGTGATPGAGDVLIIENEFSSTSHSASIGVTPDQDIDSPFTEAAGGITEADGSASGAATVSGTSGAIAGVVTAAAGLAASTVVGATLWLALAVGVGAATVDAPAATILEGVAASAGVASDSVVGVSVSTGGGVAVGIATLDGVSGATAGSIAASAGSADANAIAQITLSADGAAAGLADVLGIGVAITKTEGAASGAGTASATSASIFEGQGETAGAATVVGASQSLVVADAVSTGLSTVAAVGQGFVQGDGVALGLADASGVSGVVAQVDAASAGAATVAAIGSSPFQGEGASFGIATAEGTSGATTQVDGSGAGVAVASAEGEDAASGFTEANGSAAGTAVASGISGSTAQVEAVSAGLAGDAVAGASIFSGIGGADGTSSVGAVAVSVFQAEATTLGTASTLALGASLSTSDGTAAGAAIAAAAGEDASAGGLVPADGFSAGVAIGVAEGQALAGVLVRSPFPLPGKLLKSRALPTPKLPGRN